MKMWFRFGGVVAALILATVNMLALEGSWRGNLAVGGTQLPVVLNFSQQDGADACTMDSPNQNAYGLPAKVEFLSTDSVAVSLGMLGAEFTGRLRGEEIIGTFSQHGMQFPLTLTRDIPVQERRPQTPQPPYPYQTIDTTFLSGDGTRLAGTFAIPETFERGKTPMCVLITGSGPQNRDEELFEHKPFAVIADFLARNGVASFRYDDRGVASSRGDFASSTIDTFREDAKAALLFAKSFSKGNVGAIGHSEGGTIALLLAQQEVPDFVVTLAGMAVSGKQTIMEQNRRALKQAGMDAATIDDTMTLLSAVFDRVIDRRAKGDATPIDIDAIAAREGVTLPAPIMQSLRGNIEAANDYFASLLATDARKGMNGITCPVLALNGTLDTQVDAEENLSAIAAGVRNATIVKLPGLNHLFQHATTGDLREYSEIRETISPEVLATILHFLHP